MKNYGTLNGEYVLGIETAFSTVSVCLFDKRADHPLELQELSLVKGHAEVLPVCLAKTLAVIREQLVDLSEICVSVGPGSFTGTRIGISAAKALGAVLKIPVHGVSTTAAFAAPHIGSGLPIASVIDVGNGKVYQECFDPCGASISKLKIFDFAEAIRNLPSREVILTGTGAEFLVREATIRGANVRLEGRSDSPGADQIVRASTFEKNELPPRPLYFNTRYQVSVEGPI